MPLTLLPPCPPPTHTRTPAGVEVLSGWPEGEAVTHIAFSPDGELLAAGGQAGSLVVWQLQASASNAAHLVAAGSAAVARAAPGAVGALSWLPSADGWLLLAGSANGSTLELLHSSNVAEGFARLQTLRLEGKAGQQDFFLHLDAAPEAGLVLAADSPRKLLFSLHYSGERSGGVGGWAQGGPCWVESLKARVLPLPHLVLL